MKISPLLFFLFSIQYATSVGQEYEYVPFPTENATWKTDMWSWQCNPNTAFCEQVVLGVGQPDNLIINDTVYTGVHLAGITGQLGSAVAAIRTVEDSVTKKVWMRATTGFHQNEILLYDFNLNVGDTIPFSSWDKYQGEGNQLVGKIITVHYIDTVIIAQTTRKRFHLLQDGISSGTKIIEGIGSTCGLGPGIEFWEFEHWWELQCFLQEGAFIYGMQYEQEYVEYLQSQHTYAYCQDVTGIDEAIVNGLFRVYPNPVTGNTFRIEGYGLDPEQVKVYDALGRPVQVRKTQIDDVIVVNADFISGVYLLQIELQNSQLSYQRIVKP